MTSEDFRKRLVDYSKKEEQFLSQKKKQIENNLSDERIQKRLQSNFFTEEKNEAVSFNIKQTGPWTKTVSSNNFEYSTSSSTTKPQHSLSIITTVMQEENLKLPPGLKYIKNYITKKEGLELIKLIDGQNWDTDLQRRTQQYEYKYDYQAAYLGVEKKKIKINENSSKPRLVAQILSTFV